MSIEVIVDFSNPKICEFCIYETDINDDLECSHPSEGCHEWLFFDGIMPLRRYLHGGKKIKKTDKCNHWRDKNDIKRK